MCECVRVVHRVSGVPCNVLVNTHVMLVLRPGNKPYLGELPADIYILCCIRSPSDCDGHIKPKSATLGRKLVALASTPT